MGVIGIQLYDDDLAADVRTHWRDQVAAGLEGPRATEAVLAAFRSSADDADERCVLWLALADTQWQAGMLEERVAERARCHADEDSGRFPEADRARRRAVVEGVLERLGTRNPRPRRPRPPRLPSTDLVPGEVVAVKLRSGWWRAFEVVALEQYAGTMGVVYALDYHAERPPAAGACAGLARATTQHGVVAVLLGGATRRDQPDPERVVRLGVLRPPEPGVVGRAVLTWKFLDKGLEELFGWS
jgi:hypothetical protein